MLPPQLLCPARVVKALLTTHAALPVPLLIPHAPSYGAGLSGLQGGEVMAGAGRVAGYKGLWRKIRTPSGKRAKSFRSDLLGILLRNACMRLSVRVLQKPRGEKKGKDCVEDVRAYPCQSSVVSLPERTCLTHCTA